MVVLMLTAALAIVQDGQLTFSTAGFVALAVSTVSLLFAGYTAFSSRLVVGAFLLADGISNL